MTSHARERTAGGARAHLPHVEEETIVSCRSAGIAILARKKRAQPPPLIIPKNKPQHHHLPPVKQYELRRVVEIILEEFEDALKGASAEFKKRGRILKIILFGSCPRHLRR